MERPSNSLIHFRERKSIEPIDALVLSDVHTSVPNSYESKLRFLILRTHFFQMAISVLCVERFALAQLPPQAVVVHYWWTL